jgi:hypothetical protein
MNLIQFVDEAGGRRVGIVRKSEIMPVRQAGTVIQLARRAIAERSRMSDLISLIGVEAALPYGPLLTERRILPPIDHPDIFRCLVTGTGLTHLGSADARDRMHQSAEAADPASLSDSMRMFQLGLKGGKPRTSGPGAQPEWFYKGDGGIVVPPEGDLPMPDFALDGGEEPEIVGIYLTDAAGLPWRVGFALGNEFSDHVMERQNYLNLSHSKLRHCSIGPELLLGELPAALSGESRIRRKGNVIWRDEFLTGEDNMSHAIANLEFHHFKYDLFRRPDTLHFHFFGTATLSFTHGVHTQAGDQFEVEIPEFGAPLRNTLTLIATDTEYGTIAEL